MEINYQFKNGNEYAKVPGTSYRDNGKVRKKGVIYLGRVIDKEHHIFCNRLTDQHPVKRVFVLRSTFFTL